MPRLLVAIAIAFTGAASGCASLPRPPAGSVTIACQSDASGNVLPGWTDLARWHAWDAEKISLRTEAAMGGTYVRVGPSFSPAVPLFFFDQTQPISWKYRLRVGFTDSYFAWSGLGVAYTSETSYDGVTSEGQFRDDEDVAWVGYIDFGMYGWPIGMGKLKSDRIVDVELEWDPAGRQMQARADFGSGWSAWRTRPTRVPLSHIGGSLRWPASLLFENQGSHVDVGNLSVSGVPVFGAQDWMGWSLWNLQNAGFFGGADDSSAPLGGLTGAGSTGSKVLGWSGKPDYAGKALTQEFGGQSPGIVPEAGFGYRDLSFQVYNVKGDLSLTVRSANAANGYLVGNALSDAHVPGNSSLIASAPPIGPGTPETVSDFAVPTVQRVSLAAVPAGTLIYLDVQGNTHAGTAVENQPRLGGVWVRFHLVTGGSRAEQDGSALP